MRKLALTSSVVASQSKGIIVTALHVIQDPALQRVWPHNAVRAAQEAVLNLPAFRALLADPPTETPTGLILELPTGSGKTALGYAFLAARGATTTRTNGDVPRPRFYVTPTKQQVDQTAKTFPGDARVMYGRNSHPCVLYHLRGIPKQADEIPCRTICNAGACPHEVDQTTGETHEPGVQPCTYYEQKYLAKRGDGIVVATTAFYLVSLVYSGDWQRPDAVVLDEVHNLAETARRLFSYEMTDHGLAHAIDVLRAIGDTTNAAVLQRLLNAVIRICRTRPSPEPHLLEPKDIRALLRIIADADIAALDRAVRGAIAGGALSITEDVEVMMTLERLLRDLPRYTHRLEHALRDEERNTGPLNFVYGFHFDEAQASTEERERRTVWHRLVIRFYYVAGLVRKAMGDRVLAMSATIGDPTMIGYETGLQFPFHASTVASFPVERSRIYLPLDAPDLSYKAMPKAAKQKRRALGQILGRVAASCKRFRDAGHRSLVVVMSDAEREAFRERAATAGLTVVTYDTNGRTAKAAAEAFIAGEDDILCGTAAQFGEGIDLPHNIAPVIYFLRPGYPSPDNPQSRFEQQRFTKSRCWALWNWRVMIEALQVRGRNQRTVQDIGLCFYVSTQFRTIVPSALPEWLRPAQRGGLTWEQCEEDGLHLLQDQ